MGPLPPRPGRPTGTSELPAQPGSLSLPTPSLCSLCRPRPLPAFSAFPFTPSPDRPLSSLPWPPYSFGPKSCPFVCRGGGPFPSSNILPWPFMQSENCHIRKYVMKFQFMYPVQSVTPAFDTCSSKLRTCQGLRNAFLARNATIPQGFTDKEGWEEIHCPPPVWALLPIRVLSQANPDLPPFSLLPFPPSLVKPSLL